MCGPLRYASAFTPRLAGGVARRAPARARGETARPAQHSRAQRGGKSCICAGKRPPGEAPSLRNAIRKPPRDTHPGVQLRPAPSTFECSSGAFDKCGREWQHTPAGWNCPDAGSGAARTCRDNKPLRPAHRASIWRIASAVTEYPEHPPGRQCPTDRAPQRKRRTCRRFSYAPPARSPPRSKVRPIVREGCRSGRAGTCSDSKRRAASERQLHVCRSSAGRYYQRQASIECLIHSMVRTRFAHPSSRPFALFNVADFAVRSRQAACVALLFGTARAQRRPAGHADGTENERATNLP